MRAKSIISKVFNNSNLVQRRSFAVASQVQKNVVLELLKDSDEGVAVLSLNNTEQKNTFTRGLLDGLNENFQKIVKTNARVLILRSTVPKIFCAGANLKERLQMTDEEVREFSNYSRATITRLQFLPMPVIAALDGAALGGGLEMALACDIRISENNVKLGLVETRLAILPGAGGTVRLPRLINPALAKELIYTARVFNGVEAKEMGIVSHVVEQNEEKNAAYLKSLDIAREILPNGPVGVQMAKYAINKGLEVDINAALSFEEAAYSRIIPTKDRIEGLKAFNEKRPPKYIGE
ncbi:hypothetical protein FQA39_LY14038 [Lamprigera yunnana]|nr:hypothetical protein FQA39_LY14038 [Lamprigera yunnana]